MSYCYQGLQLDAVLTSLRRCAFRWGRRLMSSYQQPALSLLAADRNACAKALAIIRYNKC